MKAAQWMGPKNIQLGRVPKPMLTAPKDAIVQVLHFRTDFFDDANCFMTQDKTLLHCHFHVGVIHVEI